MNVERSNPVRFGGAVEGRDVKNSGIARIGSPTGWSTTEDFYAGITTGEVP